ncbi:MAG: hypothetical protein KBT03_00690 [Bacteroidales bacterium]|nr:hypothetical protein [Candidatus Scybalousia scybalohippi]
MANGFIIESAIEAQNIDKLNRSVKCADDVHGGALLALAPSGVKGDEVWTATKPATGALNGLWMAYNPEVKYLKINGKKISGWGISKDIRDYTNIAGEIFDAFKLRVDDEIEFSADCVDTPDDVVAGDYLESKADQYTLHRVAKNTGATSGHTALQVEWVGTFDFPQAGFGVDKVKCFRAVVVAE